MIPRLGLGLGGGSLLVKGVDRILLVGFGLPVLIRAFGIRLVALADGVEIADLG